MLIRLWVGFFVFEGPRLATSLTLSAGDPENNTKEGPKAEKHVELPKDEPPPGLEKVKPGSPQIKTMSVVLPCGNEGVYSRKTVQAVYNSIPSNLLKEIIVVDDASDPPLSDAFLDVSFVNKHKVKIIRQDDTQGLIRSKLAGGNAAQGDMVTFFDCHVAPQPNWYRAFFEGINDNYKRIMIPQITALDVASWKQIWPTKDNSGGLTACYITQDADFKWVTMDNDDVPALSGGLLALSKRWWTETGGYDDQMIGWGGENIDQSFRTWLCGGEMKSARSSQVAHMWRNKDPKTSAHFKRIGSVTRNRLRAASAWMGPFFAKIKNEFPLGQGEDAKSIGDLSNILKVKQKLHCKSFAWYLHRFKNIYLDGGLIPEKTFALKTKGGCLKYTGSAGTSSDGVGTVEFDKDCNITDRHQFHAANRVKTPFAQIKLLRGARNQNSAGASYPLSGIRAWNSDQCWDAMKAGVISTKSCAVGGENPFQQWRIANGVLKNLSADKCLTVKNQLLAESDCASAVKWEMFKPKVPQEWQFYQKAVQDEPDLFKDT
eukprot:GEMP01036591.1.p1 GENE.GEMP01036591.1~~GEMP01036591.1.p1  ORF type:complete len:544 (+),score=104.16 GEMP01036591.1:318-1949(+)